MPMKPRNNKCVIYARKSMCRGSDLSESCATQIEICNNYARFKKLEVIFTFKDESISGVNVENRPGLKQALYRAKKNSAMLIVYSLSRLARNTMQTIQIVDALTLAKADLCSVKEELNTSTANGKLFYKMLAIMAEWERDIISERTSEAMHVHMQNGRAMSSVPVYGWMDCPGNDARLEADPTAKKRWVKNPYEQTIVKLCVEYHKEGLSQWQTIAKLKESHLRPRDVVNKKGKHKGKWTNDKISRILKRERKYDRL